MHRLSTLLLVTLMALPAVDLGVDAKVGCVTIMRIETSPKILMVSYKINTQNMTIYKVDSADLKNVKISAANVEGCRRVLAQVGQWIGSYKTSIGNVSMGKIGYTLRIETESGTVDVTMYNEDGNGMQKRLGAIYELAAAEFLAAYKEGDPGQSPNPPSR